MVCVMPNARGGVGVVRVCCIIVLQCIKDPVQMANDIQNHQLQKEHACAGVT